MFISIVPTGLGFDRKHFYVKFSKTVSGWDKYGAPVTRSLISVSLVNKAWQVTLETDEERMPIGHDVEQFHLERDLSHRVCYFSNTSKSRNNAIMVW